MNRVHARYPIPLNLDGTTMFSNSRICMIDVKFTHHGIRVITSSDKSFFCRNVQAENRLNNLFIVLVLLNLRKNSAHNSQISQIFFSECFRLHSGKINHHTLFY